MNGIQGGRIDAQGLQDGRCHLGRAHRFPDRGSLEARMGKQQDDVGIVMREPAVLRLFGVAAGVSDADVRGHNDVWRTRVTDWVVVVNGERRAVVELPESNAKGSGIL